MFFITHLVVFQRGSIVIGFHSCRLAFHCFSTVFLDDVMFSICVICCSWISMALPRFSFVFLYFLSGFYGVPKLYSIFNCFLLFRLVFVWFAFVSRSAKA